VAVATLLLWLCTAAVGAYLLVTSVHSANAAPGPEEAEPEPEESVTVPAEQAVTAGTGPTSDAAPPALERPRRPKDRFDPPSLQRAKSEPMPGLRELAEFAHPALAVIGIGVWLGYVVSRDRVFAAVGLGILLGAIGAGLSWFTANARAARRADSGTARSGSAPLTPAPRLLILHAAGAALTLLFAVLIAVRV
jgi:hypothetical protein